MLAAPSATGIDPQWSSDGVIGSKSGFRKSLETIDAQAFATVAESVDVADLKSVVSNDVPVRVRPVALLLGDDCWGYSAQLGN